MKKRLFLLLTLCSLLLLTSCEVNWFGETKEVHFLVVLIPFLIVFCFGYFLIMRATYICPHCGSEFRPKWHQVSFLHHRGRRRYGKCPVCGKSSYCARKRKK